jgi:outer membrane receptor protein involved in Fe transport
MYIKIIPPAFLALIMANTCYATSSENLPDGSAKSDIERMTITATRKEALDTDLAMSVHGISKEELQMDNGQHVAESLNSISGVLIDQLSSGQGHKTSIRMPINTSGYYLFLQDNVPLQSAAFFNHNALWWSSFNSNVGRIEVLKGAGTALYGSGAVAATVNILTEPVADQAATNINLMLGDNQYGKVQISHSNKLSSTQGIRVSASAIKNDGWRDHTGSQRAEINLRHEYEIANNERLVTSIVASDLEQEMAANLNDDQIENNRSHSGLSDAVLDTDPLRKTQYVRLSSQWEQMNTNSYYSLIPYLRHRTNDYTATWNTNMPKIESTVNTLGLLALANFSHSADNETTVGVDFEYTQGDQLSYQPIDCNTGRCASDPYIAGDKFYDDKTTYTSISPYLQHKRGLTDNLDLTLGLRYDYAKYDFDNDLGVYGDIGHGKISLEDRDDDFSHLSPKASLNYHLNDTSSLYLRYANSFRLPTASSIYHLTTKDSNEAKPVDPETSDTFELGYKGNFASITFDAALYVMDVDDGIVHAYNNQGQRYLTNAAKVLHKGIELSTLWVINKEINMSVAYSKSKHEFDEHEKYSGNEMRMAPDYIANLRLRYSPSYFEGLSSQLEYKAIGEYWMDDKNSINPDTGLGRKYEGYSIVNLKARYQLNQQVSFYARIVNLTDKVYAQGAEYRYGRNSWSPGAPRTAYIGMNYQW